ncbi:LysM peptidoglycan-binding domain-containing protein, partial [bacterium AH-315-G05]|nr:LysM peptidoglycan-binding domain-containing protein [bacterium AH-315-G05]
AYEDIDAEIELSDARVKYELVGKNRIDIVANFDVECEVYLSEEAHLISEITEAEIKEGIEERPSLTIYSIQSGDTLWEIAKKYNSTVEIIIESNNIEDPQNLKINEYLLIQKESQFQLN